MKDKVWKIRGQNSTITDEKLIQLIKDGQINKDTHVSSKDMKVWVALKDSIYQFYFQQEDKNETL